VGVDPDPSVSDASHPGTDGPPLTELLETALSEEAWGSFSRGSAIRRAGRPGFARNVCVAMGNWLASEPEPASEAVAVLAEARSDPDALVRGHAAWALGQVGSAAPHEALETLLESEADPWVREEVALALGR
jgi:epoxyqueuosine reductase